MDAAGHASLLSGGISAAAGQPAQGDGEHQNEHQTEPKLRDTAGQRANLAQNPVRPPLLLPGTEQPQQQRQHKGQHKPHAAQKHRVAHAPLQHLQHRLFVLVGDAKIPLGSVLHPADVLHIDGVVQPQPFQAALPFLHAHLLRPVAVIGHQRVAWRQTRQVEHQQGQGQDAEQERQQLLAIIFDFFTRRHDVPPSNTKWSGATSLIRCPSTYSRSSADAAACARANRGSGMGMADSRAWV